MRVKSATATPFDEGKRSIKLGAGSSNPYDEGSVEHHNYELGREFGRISSTRSDPFRSGAAAQHTLPGRDAGR